MSFKCPHLHSNKFSGLFSYKLSFPWGSRKEFVLVRGLERQLKLGLGGRQVRQAWLILHRHLRCRLCSLPGHVCQTTVSLMLIISVWRMVPPQGSRGARLWGSAVVFILQPTGLVMRGCPSLTTSRGGPEKGGCSPWLSQAVGEAMMMSSQGRAHAEQPTESSCNESQKVMNPERR